MNFRCHHCGQMNYAPDNVATGNQPTQCFCQFCGSPNLVGGDESTSIGYSDNEATSYNSTPMQQPQGGAYGAPLPPQMPPRQPKKSSVPAFVFVILGFVVALAGVGIAYYLTSHNNDKVEMATGGDIEDQQEDFVRAFYDDCVFGDPTVKQIKNACTPRMLAEIKETDTRFALYKFLTGKNQGTGKESRLESVTALGDNQVRVNYLDNGVKGVSVITLVQDGDAWKIDDVDYEADLSEEAPKQVVKEETVVVQSDTYTFEGEVDGQYPITATITFTPDGAGYDVSGKYAYYSTLEKYGDKKTSWIHINGSVDKYNNIHWVETISGNPDYDSKLNGQVDNSRRTIRGSVGSVGEHSLFLSR